MQNYRDVIARIWRGILAGRSRNRGSILSMRYIHCFLHSVQNILDDLWSILKPGPTQLPNEWVPCANSLEIKRMGIEADRPLLRLRTSEAMPLFVLYATMALAGTTLPFLFTEKHSLINGWLDERIGRKSPPYSLQNSNNI